MQIHIYLLCIDKKTIDYSLWYISIYTIVNLDPIGNGRRISRKSRNLRLQVSDSFFKCEVILLCKFQAFCIICFLYSLIDQSTPPLSEGGITLDTVTQREHFTAISYYLSLSKPNFQKWQNWGRKMTRSLSLPSDLWVIRQLAEDAPSSSARCDYLTSVM